jgi:hypothetical protein
MNDMALLARALNVNLELVSSRCFQQLPRRLRQASGGISSRGELEKASNCLVRAALWIDATFGRHSATVSLSSNSVTTSKHSRNHRARP